MNVVGSVLRFPADVSTRLKELITSMLAKRGSKRIRLTEVMDHPWVFFFFFSFSFLQPTHFFLSLKLSPMNDPGSSLMIAHRSYMQAGGGLYPVVVVV